VSILIFNKIYFPEMRKFTLRVTSLMKGINAVRDFITGCDELCLLQLAGLTERAEGAG
jgi:hypothetical protein